MISKTELAPVEAFHKNQTRISNAQQQITVVEKQLKKSAEERFLRALSRRQFAILRLKAAGFEPSEEKRINMYSWSEEGQFKATSAGINNMLNVLNALMLVIATSVVLSPPDYSHYINGRDQLLQNQLINVWVLFSYAAIVILLYIVYISAFLYTAYAIAGEDLEALLYHVHMRRFAVSVSVGSFFSYSVLMISFFFNGVILYGFNWPLIAGMVMAILATSVVIYFVSKTQQLAYNRLPQFGICDKAGEFGVLKPEWDEKLNNFLEKRLSHSENVTNQR
jgi:hypothetical protein